jgi:hypothetical protein
MWLVNVTLLIGPNLAVPVALFLWPVLHAETKESVCTVSRSDFSGHLRDQNIQNDALCSVVAIAAIRFKYVLWLAIFASINRNPRVVFELH